MRAASLIVAGTLGAAAYVWWRQASAPADDGEASADVTDWIDATWDSMTNSTTINAALADPNVRAFLDMIAVSEGTKGRGDDGYNVVVGGRLFSDYSQHPRIVVATRYGNSDAAGRYQIMAAVPGQIKTDTWDWVSRSLGLPDFSPASQDAAAVELIRRRGALSDVQAGNIARAIYRCRQEWASLPGSPYGQRTQQIDTLIAAYQNAGGNLA